MSNRQALADYLQKTQARLSAEGFSPSADELKKKIMPSVAEGIRNLSNGAPPEVRGKFKASLEEAKVLPSFEADLDGLRAAIAKCIEILGGGPAAAPADGGYQAESAPQAAEEEEEAGDDCDDPFAMMAGMGEEEEYRVTLLEEEAKPAEEAKPEAAQAPAANGGGGGKDALLNYLQGTLAKLNADGFAPDDALLKGKIMPSVVNGVKGMTAGAPPAVRNKFKEAFEAHKVLPGYETDLDGLRAAVQKCLEIVG